MSEPAWLVAARKDIGLREIPGDKHHPRILKAFAAIGHKWLNTDEFAWCGAIMALWLIECGLPYPKNAFRALSWSTYGAGFSNPLYGAIAVLTRAGGGHVGIVTGITKDGKYVRLLGGNQGDMVKEAFFPVERVTAYRAPPGIALNKTLPVVELGEISKTER